jgi:hypothetical protein
MVQSFSYPKIRGSMNLTFPKANVIETAFPDGRREGGVRRSGRGTAMIDPMQAVQWTAAGRAVLDLMRAACALLPKGRDRDAIAQRLDEAAQALELSNAKLACELGYPLCLCVFPPKPMLWDNALDAFACRDPGCGRVERPR